MKRNVPLLHRSSHEGLPLRIGACALVLAQSCAAGFLLPVRADVRSQPQAFPMPAAGGGSPGMEPGRQETSLPSGPPRPLQADSDRLARRTYSSDPSTSGFRYRLGPGDRVRVSVFKVDGYAAETAVLSDGTINLPRIGSVNVWGLTLNEANERITKLYSSILRRPLVYIDLISPRPVRVSLIGQVERPGFYTLNQEASKATVRASGPSPEGTEVITTGWPTMVDAIQQAGGITALGDLSNLVLLRPSNTPGGGASEYRFDYLSVLMGAGTAVNPLIYDGDVIKISKVEGVQDSEALIATSSSNLAPDSILVNVVGEVVKPGTTQVRSNSPLTNAVLAAGGLDPRRAKASNVRLLRLEADGTILSRQMAFDPAAPLGSESNPPLRNGDVIVVYRNNWTRFNDTLAQAVAPLGPLLNAASLYNILTR